MIFTRMGLNKLTELIKKNDCITISSISCDRVLLRFKQKEPNKYGVCSIDMFGKVEWLSSEDY